MFGMTQQGDSTSYSNSIPIEVTLAGGAQGSGQSSTNYCEQLFPKVMEQTTIDAHGMSRNRNNNQTKQSLPGRSDLSDKLKESTGSTLAKSFNEALEEFQIALDASFLGDKDDSSPRQLNSTAPRKRTPEFDAKPSSKSDDSTSLEKIRDILDGTQVVFDSDRAKSRQAFSLRSQQLEKLMGADYREGQPSDDERISNSDESISSDGSEESLRTVRRNSYVEKEKGLESARETNSTLSQEGAAHSEAGQGKNRRRKKGNAARKEKKKAYQKNLRMRKKENSETDEDCNSPVLASGSEYLLLKEYITTQRAMNPNRMASPKPATQDSTSQLYGL